MEHKRYEDLKTWEEKREFLEEVLGILEEEKQACKEQIIIICTIEG